MEQPTITKSGMEPKEYNASRSLLKKTARKKIIPYVFKAQWRDPWSAKSRLRNL